MPTTQLTPIEFCANAVDHYAKGTLEYRCNKYSDKSVLRFSESGVARLCAICGYITALYECGNTKLAEAMADDLVKQLDYLNNYGGVDDNGESNYLIELSDDGTRHGFNVVWYRMVPYNDSPDCDGPSPDKSKYRYYFDIDYDCCDVSDYDGELWVALTCDNCDEPVLEKIVGLIAFNYYDECDCDGDCKSTSPVSIEGSSSPDNDLPERHAHRRPDLDRSEWHRNRKTKAVFAWNGGLLYHGPGAGQTYAVSLNPSLWSIHT